MFNERLLTIGNILLLICSLVQLPATLAAPQDFQNTVLMAAGQVKDVIESGAAARDSKAFEVGGVKFQSDVGVGFGDAMKQPAAGATSGSGRRKREAAGKNSSSSSSSSSSESEE